MVQPQPQAAPSADRDGERLTDRTISQDPGRLNHNRRPQSRYRGPAQQQRSLKPNRQLLATATEVLRAGGSGRLYCSAGHSNYGLRLRVLRCHQSAGDYAFD